MKSEKSPSGFEKSVFRLLLPAVYISSVRGPCVTDKYVGQSKPGNFLFCIEMKRVKHCLNTRI